MHKIFQKRTSLLLVIGFLSTGPIIATDHTDGAFLKKHRNLDITDFYAFPAGDENAPRLVLIMTLHPFAGVIPFSDTRFAPAPAEYRIRIKSADVTSDSLGPVIEDSEEELRIVCRVDPSREEEMSVSAHLVDPGGGTTPLAELSVSIDNPEGADTESLGMKAFAGIRADPFFTEVLRVRENVYPRDSEKDEFQRISLPVFNHLNVLGIVVELDLSEVRRLFPLEKPYLISAGETWSSYSATTSPKLCRRDKTWSSDPATTSLKLCRRDRQGRVEITQFLIGKQRRDLDHEKDAWNEADPFDVGDQREAFIGQLREGLEFFDAFDNTKDRVDWPEDPRTQKFLEVLVDDYLVLDPRIPNLPASDSNTYFEIERSMFQGRSPTTSGGRLPNDDVIDTTLTLFINGLDRLDHPKRRDGLTRDFKPASNEFPYLQSPSSCPGKAFFEQVTICLLLYSSGLVVGFQVSGSNLSGLETTTQKKQPLWTGSRQPRRAPPQCNRFQKVKCLLQEVARHDQQIAGHHRSPNVTAK